MRREKRENIMNILFVNACISANHPSRTSRLCEAYLEKYRESDAQITTLDLEQMALKPFDKAMLEARNVQIEKGDYEHEMFAVAKAFAEADRIVIGAPYWDLSFPSALKILVEHAMVTGITFCYTDSGVKGLCKADELVYITTSGGYIGDNNFGYDYIKAVAAMFGIEKTRFYSAEGLDIIGNNVEDIMSEALKNITKED